MNILHVIPYFTPKMGGDVNVCYNLCKNLAQRGHKVTIYTTDFKFDETFAYPLTNVSVIHFHCLLNMQLFLYSPNMKKQLKKEIKNFDIIHIHDFRTYQNSVIHHYAKKFDIPYILQAHGDIPILTKKRILKKLYDFVWGGKILKDVSQTFALTQTEVDQYRNVGIQTRNIQIVPNGIDLSEYDNLPEKGTFRHKYDIKDDEKIVLYVGRIHETKGIELLVEAFADLINKFNNVKLVLVGPDDGYKQKLLSLINELSINDKVLFTGFVDIHEKKSAFVDSDVFVTPRYYGFPITFLEACICGIPLITTTDGDEIDWIDDNVGYVVECSKNHLAEAIYKIISDKELKMKFGERGKFFIRTQFSWGKIINQIEKLYLQSISGE